MSEQRQSALAQAYRTAIIERELSKVIATYSLVPHAVEQLVKLWRDDFTCREEVHTVSVISFGGRTIKNVVAARLASPEYAHFLLPKRQA